MNSRYLAWLEDPLLNEEGKGIKDAKRKEALKIVSLSLSSVSRSTSLISSSQ